MNDIQLSVATADDLPAIRALLAKCVLSDDGIEGLVHMCVVARTGSRLVGTIGLEPCGLAGLLRSLAVAPDVRGHLIGQSLCRRVISHARMLGIERLYLLTTDAERYFARLHFKRIERSEAPSQIQATTQFRSLCPATAVCMARDISGEVVHAPSELLQLQPDVPGARMWAVSLQSTTLTYFEVAPHSRFELHSHESEQITMVLSGELFFEVHGVVYCIKAGEVLAIPSLVPHAVWTERLPVTAVDAWSPVWKPNSSRPAKQGSPKPPPQDVKTG